MLTGKQKRYLRSQAHHLNAVMQIGKQGITDNFIETFILALEAHELIKVSVLQNCPFDKDELAVVLNEKTGCEIVQIIGNQMVFYRESTKENKTDKIKLPT